MESIIQKLYDIQMNTEFENFMESHKVQKEQTYQCYQNLKQKLIPELSAELETLMNMQTEQMIQELEGSFREGFQTGVKLMVEVFEKRKND